MVSAVIDDLAGEPAGGGHWACVADTVMGGVSAGQLRTEPVAGRHARHLTGTVSLANNGGFLQLALDLAADGGTVDASAFAGLALTVCGDGAEYGVHLRTADVTRPWQSYRARFRAPAAWETVTLPFDQFSAHRLEAPLDLSRLRRLGLVAIGRPGPVDLALGDLRFY
ncbi:MAG TPA: CIA30 family protein [Pseudohaliea sp.]|nr:CIA30 family protein [Pseudohaliea sp.]